MSSHLSDFFCQKSILITGGTGFLGKCLLEKILRSCPHFTTIYVLLRPKGGQTAQKRLEALLATSLFDGVRQQLGENQLSKVKSICGDVTYDELGLNPIERQQLLESVDIIFNCAATIRFDEPLRRALQLNVGSALRVLRLAQRCSHLEALVHVSTAYCTRDKQRVLEEIPRESYSPHKLLESCDFFNDLMFEELEKHLLNGRVSSYHLTKALAEQILQEDNQNNIALAIIRPSIIVGAWKEPSPGWVDNYNGITGYLVATGKGILRSLYCREQLLCDIIPVDIVVNTLLAASRAVRPKEPPLVVNCVSGPLNAITWREIRLLSLPYLEEFPSFEIFRNPSISFHSNYLIHLIHSFLEESIPAFVVDLLFRACGLQPILTKVYQKVNRSTMALQQFTRNQWIFECENQKLLLLGMSREDKNVFPCDVTQVNWRQFFKQFVFGIRFLLLKEDPKTIPKARDKLNK